MADYLPPKVVRLPTLRAWIDESVREQMEKLTAHIESGLVSGISVSMTFRNGTSLTFASGCDSRREMMGLMPDGLLDYAKNETK